MVLVDTVLDNIKGRMKDAIDNARGAADAVLKYFSYGRGGRTRVTFLGGYSRTLPQKAKRSDTALGDEIPAAAAREALTWNWVGDTATADTGDIAFSGDVIDEIGIFDGNTNGDDLLFRETMASRWKPKGGHVRAVITVKVELEQTYE